MYHKQPSSTPLPSLPGPPSPFSSCISFFWFLSSFSLFMSLVTCFYPSLHCRICYRLSSPFSCMIILCSLSLSSIYLSISHLSIFSFSLFLSLPIVHISLSSISLYIHIFPLPLYVSLFCFFSCPFLFFSVFSFSVLFTQFLSPVFAFPAFLL